MADETNTPAADKGGYDPKGTATATHDLRLKRDEVGFEDILKPLGAVSEPTVVIPRSEYEKLTAFKDIEILGLESDETEITVSELNQIQEVAVTETVTALVNQKAEDLKKAAEAEKQTAIKKALEEQKNKKKKDPFFTKRVFFWTNVALAGVLGLAAGLLIRKQTVIYRPAPPGQSTMELTEEGKDYALRIVQNARSEIVWVTQHADDKNILDRIEARKARGPLKTLIIAGAESADTAKTAAEEANITCFVSSVPLGPANYIIVDRTFILDCTAQIAVVPLRDPTAAAALYHWADTNLGSDAALVYKEKTQAAE